LTKRNGKKKNREGDKERKGTCDIRHSPKERGSEGHARDLRLTADRVHHNTLRRKSKENERERVRDPQRSGREVEEK
jgi:hypothetical protein